MALTRYKYRAINHNGRPITGVVSAKNENDLYGQLQAASLELVSCKSLDATNSTGGFSLEKIKVRDLIQFFIHMDQMQGAGVPLLDSLADVRDGAENGKMRDMLTDIYRDVSDGNSLSEAMDKHPKVFHNLYVSLVQSGEDTGDLTKAYRQLVKYLKWVDAMQSKIRKATRYPIVVTVVVLLTIVIMMGYVVPQIVGFIANLDQALPFYTVALIETSNFFKVYGLYVLIIPVILFGIYKALRHFSDEFRFHTDSLLLKMPIAGPLMRKISIARYSQTFGALFAAGIDVIGSLRASRKTVGNLALSNALESVEVYVQAGNPLSDAMNACGEFPSMVIRMVKIGEESGNLTPVLEQVSDFYTKDVDEAVEGLIAMIEPALTGLLGGIILWIAAGVFGPIYSSFENIDF